MTISSRLDELEENAILVQKTIAKLINVVKIHASQINALTVLIKKEYAEGSKPTEDEI
jgi:hypothetical protein